MAGSLHPYMIGNVLGMVAFRPVGAAQELIAAAFIDSHDQPRSNPAVGAADMDFLAFL